MQGTSRARVCFLSAAVAAIGLVVVAPDAARAATPVLSYTFPASWNGTGTAVTDQSPAGNNGITIAGKLPVLSNSALPADATPGTDSIVISTGGVQTAATSLLTNPTIASAGGFTYSLEFMWNGTDRGTANNHIQKLIDYAGTESLQVDTTITGANPGTATLSFIFTTQGSPNDITTGPSMTILANTWYRVMATFDTQGNLVDGGGSIAGLATLTAGPVGGSSTTSSMAVTKTIYGDGSVLGPRPIGIGELGYPNLALVPFQGDIYNPSVSLGVVPEPASLSLLGLGATALLARRRRA